MKLAQHNAHSLHFLVTFMYFSCLFYGRVTSGWGFKPTKPYPGAAFACDNRINKKIFSDL